MVEIWHLYKDLNANKMHVWPNFTFAEWDFFFLIRVFSDIANHLPTGLPSGWFLETNREFWIQVPYV